MTEFYRLFTNTILFLVSFKEERMIKAELSKGSIFRGTPGNGVWAVAALTGCGYGKLRFRVDL
jgi:hypothetical protein